MAAASGCSAAPMDGRRPIRGLRAASLARHPAQGFFASPTGSGRSCKRSARGCSHAIIFWPTGQGASGPRARKRGFSAAGRQGRSRSRWAILALRRPSTACCQDREGYLWVGTDAGLHQLRPRLLRTYSVVDGLPHRECWSVCEAADGAIWVGTARGVVRIKDGHVQGVPGSLRMRARPHSWIGTIPCGWATVTTGSSPGDPAAERIGFGATRRRTRGRECRWKRFFGPLRGDYGYGTGLGVTWFENGRPAARWGEQICRPTVCVRSTRTRDGTMWFGTWQGGCRAME